MSDLVRLSPEVSAALQEGRPVVALESTIISHGLPRPENLTVAREAERIVAEEGAVPATIALLGGTARIGLSPDELAHVAESDGVVKVSIRDVAAAMALGRDGATTVASTAHLAHRAGIRVFATGGLGGVHREARESWDESADLPALGQIPVVVVCAGVKSVLDVGATLERMETYSIGLVGYGTDRFPGFYLSDSGFPVPWRADHPKEVAQVLTTRDALGLPQALVVANPLPPEEQLDPDLHDRVLEEGLRELRLRGVKGKDVTPFLLDHFHRATAGRSLEANVRIILRNARLAAQIAVALGDPRP
ncbi:MAG: pseudouridine-5'-phosphate glycosidase [Frankiaceae bacterium]